MVLKCFRSLVNYFRKSLVYITLLKIHQIWKLFRLNDMETNDRESKHTHTHILTRTTSTHVKCKEQSAELFIVEICNGNGWGKNFVVFSFFFYCFSRTFSILSAIYIHIPKKSLTYNFIWKGNIESTATIVVETENTDISKYCIVLLWWNFSVLTNVNLTMFSI